MAKPLPFDADLDALELGLVVRFGSRARGDARPNSDLDLAVLRASGERLNHRALGALRLDLEERFGWVVDVVDLATADCIVRREIVRDAEVLHAKDPNQWVYLVTRTLIDLDDLGPMLQACVEGVLRRAKERAA